MAAAGSSDTPSGIVVTCSSFRESGASMEFGIFNSLYVPHHLTDVDLDHAEHNRLMDEVAWVEAADRAGFKYTWATEHHFLQEYSHLSANESFLAFVAARTRRIHIGSGIFNIT